MKNHGSEQAQGKRFESVYDKRLAFINECDAKQFKNIQKVLPKGQSEDDFLADDPD